MIEDRELTKKLPKVQLLDEDDKFMLHSWIGQFLENVLFKVQINILPTNWIISIIISTKNLQRGGTKLIYV